MDEGEPCGFRNDHRAEARMRQIPRGPKGGLHSGVEKANRSNGSGIGRYVAGSGCMR
jgi:hypothetical protein